MTREEALAVLKSREPELRARGIAHAGLFGSLARGENGAASDIDVLLRFEADAAVTLWDYVALKRLIAGMLKSAARKVDVIDLDGMSSHARPAVERDVLYAF